MNCIFKNRYGQQGHFVRDCPQKRDTPPHTKDASYTVWADFDRVLIHQGRLVLRPYANEYKRKITSTRELGPPPAVYLKDDFSLLNAHSVYRRGAASPLIRLMGVNPHEVVKPLRHAYFATLSDENRVISEEFPAWNSEKECVEWYAEDVTINKNTLQDLSHYVHLLGMPDVAFKELFPLEASFKKPARLRCNFKDWSNHCFACKCLVNEMCCAFTGTELLGQMLQ